MRFPMSVPAVTSSKIQNFRFDMARLTGQTISNLYHSGKTSVA